MSEAVSCPFGNLAAPETYVEGMPRKAIKFMHEQAPVVWQDDPIDGGGYWAITRQQEIDYVSKHPQQFSSHKRTCFNQPDMTDDEIAMMQLLMINMDPPDHLKFRRIVRAAFTPKMVESYGEHFREVIGETIDKVMAKGECEFVEDVACELPLIAICEILGVPVEDRQQFFEWTNTMIGGTDPEVAADKDVTTMAQMQLWAYADKIMEQHEAGSSNDIVDALLSGTVDGEALTPDEFRSFMLILIVAGNETTRTATSQGMRLLIEHPEQYQMLVDNPALVEDAVEEILRFNAPIVQFKRTAMEDVELGGASIKKDDKVVLFYQAAGMDDNNFKEPETFDITRPQREDVRNLHRAFGIGQHFCLGSHLARQELKVTFEEIVKRWRNPRLSGELAYLQSNLVNGIKRMPLTFEAAA